MNETDLIRQQIASEQQHTSEVIESCAAALEMARASSDIEPRELLSACVEYLRLIERRARSRARAHLRRLRGIDARLAAGAELRARLSPALAAASQSFGALEAGPARMPDGLTSGLAGADINSEELKAYIDYIMSFMPSLAELDSLAAAVYTIADWRAACGVDADGVLAERARYAAVLAQLQLHAPGPS